MLTVSGVSKNSGNRVMIVISRESLHEPQLPGYPPSVADDQHPYVDPWGLPAEDSSDLVPSPKPSEPEMAEEQSEPKSSTDVEPEEEPEVEPEEDDTIDVDAGEVDKSEEEGFESGPDESPEHADDTLISPMHMEAKNVLDTLGAGIDDLPDEPPDWMDSTAGGPPSVYRELTDLQAATAYAGEDAESETAEDVGVSEAFEAEPPDTEPTETFEAEQPEEDLEEAVASALSAIEPPDTEPTETFEAEQPEEDLEEAVASALSAVEPSGISDMEGKPGVIESPTVAWGSNWGSSAQGWIRQDGGRSTWRPIVTTTSDVGAWEVDTFLGIVAGDATVAEAGNLAGARKAALQALVDEALSRGAHAVVGVRAAVHEVGRSVVFSAIGTAVTLRNPS